ncbi:MAG: dihydropteroate synthase [Verrucomicrobiaceae bacterium]|nr:MAG: dihydropteroate synthase [Verrucomicrobiaceae bacterium]
MIWRTLNRTFDLSARGVIMGVLNITPDSFSDGGQFLDPAAAVEKGLQMVADGAEILDIGGESTRPGAVAVGTDEELRRILPVIRRLREASRVAISIDTMKASVAAAAVEAGAEIINDISGLRADPGMAGVAARTGAGLVLMHMRGTPRTMQIRPEYSDVTAEVAASLTAACDEAVSAGVNPECIAVDPGIGFGKTMEHNLTLLRSLARFQIHGRPVLLGVSRKSFLGRILGLTDPVTRDGPTAAITAWARQHGVRIFRVHAVRHNVHALRMMEAILEPE